MPHKYADLHCHPHMRSFNWLHKGTIPEEKSKYHPWWIILSKHRAQKKGKRAAAYSQSDLAKLNNAHVALAFAALYPMEKGWVKGSKKLIKGRIIDFNKLLGTNAFNDFLSDAVSLSLKPIFHLIGKDKGDNIALRDFLQSVYMKLPYKRINFFQSNHYDYFHELKEEWKYLKKQNDTETRSEIFIPWQKRLFQSKKKARRRFPKDLDAKGTYTLAKNGQHVKEIIEDNKTALVLTIEGANVFNSHDTEAQIILKIKEIKGWDEPIFFLTLCHHFYNDIAGQAHSIPDIGGLLLDQSEGLKQGFTAKGLSVSRFLLSIDKNNTYLPEKFGKRILIDVKHMNAKSRKEYYDSIIKPCFEKGDRIPIIASHVAYSGRETLSDLISHMDNEKDGFTEKRFEHEFNAWNINLCDEDILNIFTSGGLIGINFDQRVLGIPAKHKDNNKVHIHYVWQNMKAMLRVIIESDREDLPAKQQLVSLLCLGTDFDGYIDPVNNYATALDFDAFRIDLIKTILKDSDKEAYLFGQTVEAFVDRICFKNAYDFVQKHF